MIDTLPGLYRIEAGRSHCELFPKITDAIRNGTRFSVLEDLLAQEPTAEIRYLGITSPYQRPDFSSHIVEVDRYGNVSFFNPDMNGQHQARVDPTRSERDVIIGDPKSSRTYLNSAHGLTIHEGGLEITRSISLQR